MKFTQGQKFKTIREVSLGLDTFPLGSTVSVQAIDEDRPDAPYIIQFEEKGIINVGITEVQLTSYIEHVATEEAMEAEIKEVIAAVEPELEVSYDGQEDEVDNSKPLFYTGVDWASGSDMPQSIVMIGNLGEKIAKICHNVNKAYCESTGDMSQPTWEEAPDWQRESAVNGVTAHMNGTLSPAESHESWMKEKVEAGWVYGPDKNPESKTHPCIMPYDELPQEQRVKDYLFKAVVDSFK